jgi:cyclopropane-fatty-acyl-phospholipid synthase
VAQSISGNRTRLRKPKLPGASPPVATRVERVLHRLAGGALRERPVAIRFWDGSELPASIGDDAPTVVIRDPAAAAYLIREPNDVGLGRAWVAGLLDVEGDLSALLARRYRLREAPLTRGDRLRAALCAGRILGARAWRQPPAVASEARPIGRKHSLRRDRAAVRHHYELPPAFYRLVLGPSLVYSCAYFATPEESLERAQARKLELICHKLRLQAGDRLLDIGCGWGSLVIHAAVHHGVYAVGITLSESQAEVARDRAHSAGVGRRCEIRVADYREISHQSFDAVASVGMYEHVGRSHLASYARRVHDLLAPGALFLNHGIARLTSPLARERTFISAFVFPDGELHPIGDLACALQLAGMEIRDLESLREHYALTLARWVANLEGHRHAAIGEAAAEVERIYRLYITGAAEAFQRGELSVFQALAARPGRPHRLPLRRTAPSGFSGSPHDGAGGRATSRRGSQQGQQSPCLTGDTHDD